MIFFLNSTMYMCSGIYISQRYVLITLICKNFSMKYDMRAGWERLDLALHQSECGNRQNLCSFHSYLSCNTLIMVCDIFAVKGVFSKPLWLGWRSLYLLHIKLAFLWLLNFNIAPTTRFG